jgi:hypothetical protein
MAILFRKYHHLNLALMKSIYLIISLLLFTPCLSHAGEVSPPKPTQERVVSIKLEKKEKKALKKEIRKSIKAARKEARKNAHPDPQFLKLALLGLILTSASIFLFFFSYLVLAPTGIGLYLLVSLLSLIGVGGGVLGFLAFRGIRQNLDKFAGRWVSLFAMIQGIVMLIPFIYYLKDYLRYR